MFSNFLLVINSSKIACKIIFSLSPPCLILSYRNSMFAACQTPTDYVASSLVRESPSCSPAVVFHSRPLPTGRPFPHIFSPAVGASGRIDADAKR